MWQLAKDVQDGIIKATFLADEWPDFTTVISQVLDPHLSDVCKHKTT